MIELESKIEGLLFYKSEDIEIKKLAELFQIDNQRITDLFFADKFAREAFKYKCSDSIFIVAEDTSNYIKSTNVKQGKLDL